MCYNIEIYNLMEASHAVADNQEGVRSNPKTA